MDYEWEVGQEVVVSNRHRSELATVDRVTPTGLVSVRGKLFHKNGRERGGSDPWSTTQIEPATPELVEVIRAETALRSARAEALALIEKARVGGGRHVKMEQWLGVIAALKEEES
jgi:hypothetical protein